MSSPEEPVSFAEIIETGFWQDPTDGTFTEAHFQEVHSEYVSAIRRGDPKMWELADKLRTIAKFLPSDDERNPDNPDYQ